MCIFIVYSNLLSALRHKVIKIWGYHLGICQEFHTFRFKSPLPFFQFLIQFIFQLFNSTEYHCQWLDFLGDSESNFCLGSIASYFLYPTARGEEELPILIVAQLVQAISSSMHRPLLKLQLQTFFIYKSSGYVSCRMIQWYMFWACKVISRASLVITANVVSVFALGETPFKKGCNIQAWRRWDW